jgi:hypothetical protein
MAVRWIIRSSWRPFDFYPEPNLPRDRDGKPRVFKKRKKAGLPWIRQSFFSKNRKRGTGELRKGDVPSRRVI